MSNRTLFPVQTQSTADLPLDLGEIVKAALRQTETSKHPILIHMLGVPGSGKTKFAHLLRSALEGDHDIQIPIVGFDKIMSAMPSYIAETNAADAFQKYELPARNAGYALVEQMLQKRSNILFDHGGADLRHPQILRYASEKHGYQCYVVYIKCDRNIAKERIAQRLLSEGRYTPPNYVDERQKMIDQLLEQYATAANGMIMYENNATADRYLVDFSRNTGNYIHSCASAIINGFK